MGTFKPPMTAPSVAVLVAILSTFLTGTTTASNDDANVLQPVYAESDMIAGRNELLEARVAEQLRMQGFGQASRVLVMATGDHVYLLGVVPDQNTRKLLTQAAEQVPGVEQVADYLLVGTQLEPTSDVQLRRDVERALALLPANRARGIQVRANNEDVLLRGRVSTWDDAAKAVQAAFSAGANYVLSELSVANPMQYYTDRPPEGSPPPVEDYDSVLGYVAEPNDEPEYEDQHGNLKRNAGERGQRSWERQPGRFEPRWVQSAQDRQAQQQLASRLLTSIEGGQDIHVLVRDRQAFLLGRIPDDAQRNRAAELALSIEGIEHVRNRLSIAPRGWPQQADPEIEDAIESELYWSPFVDAQRVDVSVNAGVAVLRGTVDSFGAMIAAIESAFDGGARAVQNQLRLSRQTAAEGSHFGDTAQSYRSPRENQAH